MRWTSSRRASLRRSRAFADNTMRYLRDEGRLLAEGIDFPALATRFRDRHVLVVARGPGHKHDLRDRPAVHPGLSSRCSSASTAVRTPCVEAGYRPDVIVGDMDSVTDETLASGAELVVHAYPSTGDRARSASGRAARPSVPRGAGARHQRGRRAAVRVREGRGADRRRRYALQSRGVSRAEPGGHVVDVHGAAARGGDPRRREGRLSARQRARRRVAARRVRRSRPWRRSSSRSLASPDLRSFIQLLGQRLLTMLGIG